MKNSSLIKKQIRELESEFTRELANLETDDNKYRLQVISMNRIQDQIEDLEKDLGILELLTEAKILN